MLKRYAEMTRSMRLEDAPQVADIHTRAWQVAYRGIISQALLDEIEVLEREEMWREKLIPNSKRTNLVFEDDGQIKGWSAFGQSGENMQFQELIGIYVDPNNFREGVGSELWKTTENLMLNQNPEYLTLWVLEANHRARGFYERMGFVGTEESRQVEWLGGVREVQYIKKA